MVGGLALGSEIKRFARNRMTRIAIVVLMLMPLSYGALYLWAYWDPFGHVNKLPVALVNADRGTEVSGQPMNVAPRSPTDSPTTPAWIGTWSTTPTRATVSRTASTTSCWNCRPTSAKPSHRPPPVRPARRN